MSAGNTAVPEIFTLIGEKELVINKLNELSAGMSFAVGIRPGKAGTYTLTLNEGTVTGELSCKLTDHHTGATTQLGMGESYTFTSDGEVSNDRFNLELRAPGMTTGTENLNGKLTFSTTEGRISIDGTTEGSPISIYNLPGQQLMTQTASNSYTELNHKFQPGVYIVRINNTSIKVTVK